MLFRSVCPAAGQYVLGAPLFRRAVLHLENGKDFVINAPANSGSNIYVQAATLDGKPYTKNWLAHTTILAGGEFKLTMGATPNLSKGVSAADYPYSFSTDKTKPEGIK